LGIEQNCIITIKAKGKDARIALNSLVELIKNGIGETE
jgi:phosphotransferase system HPr-like phosphotransfer protein